MTLNLPDGAIALPPHHPHCLGCGPENPASLNAKFYLDGDRVFGEVCFDRRQEGAPGLAHGGAISTVLDDALGTLLLVLRRPAVTARLAVNFRSPALLNRELRVEAWVDRIDGRKLHLAGRVLDGETVIAEADGLFLQVEIDHFQAGGENIPAEWQQVWTQTETLSRPADTSGKDRF